MSILSFNKVSSEINRNQNVSAIFYVHLLLLYSEYAQCINSQLKVYIRKGEIIVRVCIHETRELTACTNHSGKASGHLSGQEVPSLLYNSKVCVCRNTPMYVLMNHVNPNHSPCTYVIMS
jgi:hypothetical protein